MNIEIEKEKYLFFVIILKHGAHARSAISETVKDIVYVQHKKEKLYVDVQNILVFRFLLFSGNGNFQYEFPLAGNILKIY